jgi:hypothetical protein
LRKTASKNHVKRCAVVFGIVMQSQADVLRQKRNQDASQWTGFLCNLQGRCFHFYSLGIDRVSFSSNARNGLTHQMSSA